jgi:hypothetical protein
MKYTKTDDVAHSIVTYSVIAAVTLGMIYVSVAKPSGVSHADIAKLAKYDREHQAERAEYIERARFIYGDGTPAQLEALGRALDE